METYDYALLAIAGYVATMALVRMMAARHRRLVEIFSHELSRVRRTTDTSAEQHSPETPAERDRAA